MSPAKSSGLRRCPGLRPRAVIESDVRDWTAKDKIQGELTARMCTLTIAVEYTHGGAVIYYCIKKTISVEVPEDRLLESGDRP